MQDIIPPNNTRRGQIRSTDRRRIISRPVSARPTTLYGSIDGIMAPVQVRIVEIEDSSPGSLFTLESKPVYGTRPHLRRPLAHAAVKADIVARAVAAQTCEQSMQSKMINRSVWHFKPRQAGLVFGVIIVLALTGYVSIDTWTTNNKVKAEFSQSDQTATVASADQKAQEGHDETVLSKNSLADYKVAASLPRVIYINKINISARVIPMSVNVDGSVQAPRNIFDSGWYSGSVKPGEIGAMFIDGHASGPTREGLFAYLDKLVVGDMIEIEKGDSSRLKYKVVHTEIQPLDNFDMKKMLLPYGTVLKGLNLMTCTGKWVESSKTFDKRVLVFAEQVL